MKYFAHHDIHEHHHIRRVQRVVVAGTRLGPGGDTITVRITQKNKMMVLVPGCTATWVEGRLFFSVPRG